MFLCYRCSRGIRLRLAGRPPPLFCFQRNAHVLSISKDTIDWNSQDEFFSFTRGRFVCDEVDQLAKRHIRFDMNALAQVAATSIGAKSCTMIKKCPDGLYNKAFLMKMDNGREVIAKVPNPNAGIPHLTTASEVATMDFVRRFSGVPTPEVHAWSSRAETNAVGAEYIIMEKIHGVPLSQVWNKLNPRQKLPILLTVGEWYKSWLSIRFPRSGCIYYANDVEIAAPLEYLFTKEDGKKVCEQRFVVGPAVGREWCDDGRSGLHCDRGPWASTEDSYRAIAQREILAAKSLPLPRQLVMLCGPGLFSPLAEKKVKVLESFLQVFADLIPHDDDITGARLWHNDLHDENIFVDPSNPSKVTGVIDWQSTQASPLFNHSPDPGFLGYDGPEPDVLEPPAWPDTSGLSKEEKARVVEEHELRSLFIAFRMIIKKRCPALHKTIEFQKMPEYRVLLLSRRIFEVGEAHFRSSIADLADVWPSLPKVQQNKDSPLPSALSLSDSERNELEEDVAAAAKGIEIMDEFKERLGPLWPDKGVVRHEDYDEVKRRLEELKVETLDRFATSEEDRKKWDKYWPFD